MFEFEIAFRVSCRGNGEVYVRLDPIQAKMEIC